MVLPALRGARRFDSVDHSPYQSEARFFVIVSSPIQFDPTISSILTSIMITSSNSPFEESGMPNHADSSLLQIAVELLCFSPAVLESPLTEFSRLRIHERNLLNARVIIATYNQHIGSFLPSIGLVGTTKSTQLQGADIVMKSFPPAISS